MKGKLKRWVLQASFRYYGTYESERLGWRKDLLPLGTHEGRELKENVLSPWGGQKGGMIGRRDLSPSKTAPDKFQTMEKIGVVLTRELSLGATSYPGWVLDFVVRETLTKKERCNFAWGGQGKARKSMRRFIKSFYYGKYDHILITGGILGGWGI